ncbi:MAG TPA: penicillin acylase family protein [Thermoleophilaceae bacterium]|nr:penicillin acylase family protein [Thermoleophilaceae bacterium]
MAPTRRPSSALAGALAAAGAGSIGLWYQLFRRPLPKTRGRIEVKGLESTVAIERDQRGVARIEARSTHDFCFAHGFAHAQDRLWQLEFYRRVGAGRVSEFAGPEGVQIDRLMRTLGLRRFADREVELLPQHDLDVLSAYAAGVNAAIESAPALPLEHQLLRVEPEPWEVQDSLVIRKIIALGFSTNMETELFRAELVAKIGAEKTARLEPQYPHGNPLVLNPGVAWSGDALDLVEQIAEVREAIGWSLEPAGSNNWAVSGERSVTGMPLLAGDPHITTSIPDSWYTIEASTPDLELRGGSMAGFPGLVIGHTRHVAWSFTNVMADVQDLFVEHIRDGENGPEYEFQEEWRPVTVHHEQIRVKGKPPVNLEVRETHHGPVVNSALGAERGEPLALAWTAIREPVVNSTGVDVGSLKSGQELVEAFRGYSTPCMNMVWADDSGNIGYKLVGKIPIRRGGCPDLPKPGWTGEYEWEGYIPYDELPETVNPPGGVLATANNRIAPDDYPHHITSEYLDGYRAARIEQLLGERDKHSLDDFERIQLDLYSIPGEQTAHRLARLRPTGQREIRAIERLKSWDHRLEPDTIAGTIYAVFTAHFARAVSEAVIGDPDYAERWRSRSQLGFTPMVSSPWRFQARLIELWDEGDEALIGGRSWDELALAALAAALDELEERHGSDPAGWTWGRVHGVRFAHTLAEGEGRASKVLDRLLSRRLAAGGGQETVCQVGFVPHQGDYTGAWAPSYRLLADLARPERSRWQHMTGQSGHPGSPHYDDLLEDWQAGRSYEFGEPAAETLQLDPA